MVLAISSVAFGQIWEMAQGSATIDANLSDWAGANWINMDATLYGDPANLSNVKMAVRWDTNNIYMAVTYDDANLQLSQGCLSWDGQDDIEVYINANNDDVNYYNTSGQWNTAQHYLIGANGTSSTGLSSTPAVPAATWYSLADYYPLPSATWPNTVIDVATKVTGNSLVYEMRIPAFCDMAAGTMQTLSAGDTVGFDVVAADKGTSNYGWKALNMDGDKFKNAGQLQDWTLVNEVTAVHYTFEETAPGTWDVLVDVSGDNTAGLSAYEIWVDNVDPGTVIFTENTLATVVDSEAVGFSSANFLTADIGGNFNAGNYQNSGTGAILGIGKEDIYLEGSETVNLDAQALLGTITTELTLTADNFRVVCVGLLNAAGDGFFDADSLISTIEVIPYEEEVLLPGDANRDGVVSAGDYASVQANFGHTGEPGLLGDANCDGVVSAGDYASVQANFGSVAGSLVPEPVTMGLLVLGGMGLICRRKR